ncbi:hypothetical protein PHYSODRAFT_516866 [Phytophthora sojae]|uniref:DUF7869 domain-containing protein n=1 Tax=Phytophthora sojae (strain P6497) TaxID=1094619 RepID=G4ZVI5_PHYSP|nr:hypothetical protein PHYSODRAFT_516866 [Phytophthora sojae]EGZ12224.1 hypothetical protein PHYSODRAFT_516866 [Phytophthora sojae]|eukprot:XP_009532557.1 hypothetical protein PHYSODRAFT_516866 [Phytophthora sojae]
MLAHFISTKIIPAGKTRLTVYADNCSGQNKNNYVIKFLLAQVHMGALQHVDYKFFVKRHTKNSCDRGFGHIRKHVAKVDCWTMDHLVEAVSSASKSSITVHLPRGSSAFKSYKPILTELYKRLDGIQKFQIFTMDASQPGVVVCKKGPESELVEISLSRRFDGIFTTKEKVQRMMTDHIETLSPPVRNTEKIAQMYHNIKPYVPAEFQSDPLYAKPSEQEGEDAKSRKQARREHRAAMAVAAKANQDQRGITEAVATKNNPAKKRATAAKKTQKNKKHKATADLPAEQE